MVDAETRLHAEADRHLGSVGVQSTECDGEECLGENHHKIQKWIANGWLRDRLQGPRTNIESGTTTGGRSGADGRSSTFLDF